MIANCMSMSGYKSTGNNKFIFMLLLSMIMLIAFIYVIIQSDTFKIITVPETTQFEKDTSFLLIQKINPDSIIRSEHANKHQESSLIRKACSDSKNIKQLWREKQDKSIFHILCILPTGKIGDWVIKIVGSTTIEVTAFCPKDGTWMNVINYLSTKAVRFTQLIVSKN